MADEDYDWIDDPDIPFDEVVERINLLPEKATASPAPDEEAQAQAGQ